MTALTIKKLTDCTSTGISSQCEGACVPANVKAGRRRRARNSSVRVAYLAGYPAAGLCARCAKDWERLFAEFGGGV